MFFYSSQEFFFFCMSSSIGQLEMKAVLNIRIENISIPENIIIDSKINELRNFVLKVQQKFRKKINENYIP